MPFSYYNRLNRTQKAIYRKSDRTTWVQIGSRETYHGPIARLGQALEQEIQASVRKAARELCRRICESVGVEPVEVKVLARRPSSASAELHGLYVREEGKPALITVWMRTARHRRVVAFRTFLRTLLHELCHHLDYTFLGLKDSFHTQGFFKRESSLVSQLLGPEAKTGRKKAVRSTKKSKPVQTEMKF
jgi:hypothetical protein